MKKDYYQKYRKEQVALEVDRVILKRLLKYFKPYRWLLLLAIIFLLISKGIEVSVPIFIGNASQAILNLNQSSVDNHVILDSIVSACLAIFTLLAISYLLEATNVFLKTYIGQKSLWKLRVDVFNHIQQMPLKFFDHQSVGRLMTRTVHDIDQIDLMFSESIVPIIGSAILFLGMFIGIIYVDWHIALIITLFLPLIWWLTSNFRFNQRRCFEILRSIVSAMNGFVQEHLLGISTIRTFGLQKHELKKFEDINNDQLKANLENVHNFAFFIAGIEFLQNSILISIFAFMVILAGSSEPFEAGKFLTFTLYAVMFFRPLGDLAERYNVLQSAMAAAGRIFNIIDQPSEDLRKKQGRTLNDVEEIIFDDVWFAYNDENWILKGFSFKLSKGESLALVGTTGAGKTTITNLLLRLYEYQKGSIKINGHEIHEYSLESLRRQFSLVLQDPVIFSGTIAENISLYRPDITLDDVEKAVDFVNMHDFIAHYRDGLLHRLSERGGNLSAGEMQLISLARAVANDRSVFLLDEATANIDSRTEMVIQNALEKIMKQKTSIVIAHRLSTIKNVNRILVLHQGVVKESGTHSELLQAKGIYEKLYRLQF